MLHPCVEDSTFDGVEMPLQTKTAVLCVERKRAARLSPDDPNACISCRRSSPVLRFSRTISPALSAASAQRTRTGVFIHSAAFGTFPTALLFGGRMVHIRRYVGIDPLALRAHYMRIPAGIFKFTSASAGNHSSPSFAGFTARRTSGWRRTCHRCRCNTPAARRGRPPYRHGSR